MLCMHLKDAGGYDGVRRVPEVIYSSDGCWSSWMHWIDAGGYRAVKGCWRLWLSDCVKRMPGFMNV